MHYNYHRYYDPETGRYLTPDPIGLAGGINLFVYSLNNPVNYIDPEGLDPNSLYPNQKFNPTNKTPKVTQPNIRSVPSELPPKITPENFNPNGINNLPGKKLPMSEKLSKDTKGAVNIFNGIRLILKFLESGSVGAPVLMINPDLYPSPEIFNKNRICPPLEA